MYAVDSLRQLSLKFLSKDEMAGFNFQRMFLKPFEIIMLRNSNTEVREFILSSLNHLLLAKAPNVRSGWKSIFAVFAIAGGLEEEMICNRPTMHCTGLCRTTSYYWSTTFLTLSRAF